MRKEHKDAHRDKSNDLHGSSVDRNGNFQGISCSVFDHSADL